MPKRKPTANIVSKPKRAEPNPVSESMEKVLTEITTIPNDGEHSGPDRVQVIRQELDGTFSLSKMDAVFTADDDDALGYLIFGMSPNRKSSVN